MWRNNPFKSEKGMSFVELLVCLGIIVILGAGAAMYLGDNDNRASVAKARQHGGSLINQVVARFEKDILVRTLSAFGGSGYQVSNGGRRVQVQRGTQTVTYESLCRSLPTQLRAVIGKSFSSSPPGSSPTASRCLRSLRCPKGSSPYIRFQSGSVTKEIPSLQDIQKASRTKAIGACLLAEDDASLPSMNLRLEVVYIDERKDPVGFGILEKDQRVAKENTANIEILEAH